MNYGGTVLPFYGFEYLPNELSLMMIPATWSGQPAGINRIE